MMLPIFRFTLATGLMIGLATISAAAGAAPVGVGAVPAVAQAGEQGSLLRDVRWTQRCRPVTVYRRDRFGRPLRVVRTQCRRVWVGPGRPY